MRCGAMVFFPVRDNGDIYLLAVAGGGSYPFLAGYTAFLQFPINLSVELVAPSHL